MFEFATKKLVRAGVVAGLYAVLTFVTASFASGFVQFRLSEALCVLPIIMPEAIAGLAVGCLVANVVSGCVALDVVFGSIISLVAAVLTRICAKGLKKTWAQVLVGGVFPVVLNAAFLPLIWYFVYGELQTLYVFHALSLLASESVSVYLLGAPVLITAKKTLCSKKEKSPSCKE